MLNEARINFYRALLAVALIVAAFFGAMTLRYYTKDRDWSVKWADRNTADGQAKAERLRVAKEQEDENRRKTDALRDEADENDIRLRNDIKNAQSDAQREIERYRSSAVRLREELRCAASSIRDKSSPPVAGSDGASNCGLSNGDVEFLVWYAAEAKKTAVRLEAAQRELCSWYLTVNGSQLNYEVCKNGSSKESTSKESASEEASKASGKRLAGK